ncbi:ABC transporter ATP-binding protein [Enterococcus cecorum]|nr:ABC transporter ATP-binding protein [Enterococcus cecorum]
MILSFEDVSLIRNQLTLLQDINWQIKKEEHWGILGLNGAGKSLLLQLITGNLWPTTGKLTVLGQTFGHTSIPELNINKRIGWIANHMQTRLPQYESAEKIVLSGKFASFGIYQEYKKSELEQAKEILVQLHAQHLIGKPFQVLSQGEKQIVLIARALISKPELLILDEPCNGLDLFAKEQFLGFFNQLMETPEAPTLLFVTHHIDELPASLNQLLMLKQGRIFAQGPLDLLMQPDNLQNFYEQAIQIIPIQENRVAIYPKFD